MKRILTTGMFFLLTILSVQAQESPVSTGGNASGSGGSVSYSVGQVMYLTKVGVNGSVSDGVQQPFEISTIVGINETSINLTLSVYPNPTTQFLHLTLAEFSGVSYQLFSLDGQQIELSEVNQYDTIIKMGNLPSAAYVLHVMKNNQLVKTYKIIKN